MAELDALKFEIQDETLGGTRIKVIGVGGGGSNAVNRMLEVDVTGVEFYVMNSDAQALRASKCTNRIPIGARITHGLGAGSDPLIGRQAALEDTDRIVQVHTRRSSLGTHPVASDGASVVRGRRECAHTVGGDVRHVQG